MAAESRSFLKDAASVMSSRVASLVLSFVGGVILARVLGPDGKGTVAALTIYPALIMGLAELGTRQATIYHLGKKIYPERDVVGASMFLLVLTSTLGVGVCAIIFWFLGNPNFSLFLIILALVGIPIGLAQSMAQGVLLGQERIGSYSAISWLSPLLRIFAVLVFVWLLGWGVAGEMIGSVVTGLIMLTCVFVIVSRTTRIEILPNINLSKELLSLGFVYAIALFIIGLNYKIDIVILERLVSVGEIGQYTLGVNLAELLWQLPAALGVVVFSRSANAKDPALFTQNVIKLLRITLIIAVVGAVVLGLAASFVIPLVYGEQFAPSVTSLRLILPGIVAFTVFKVLNVDLAGRGRPRVSLYAVAPAVLLNVGLNFWLIPLYSINGAAIASTISYIVAVIIYVFIYAKVVEIPVRSLFLYRKSDFDFISKLQEKVSFRG